MSFILCSNIQEYDINSANISIFKAKGIMSEEEHSTYNKMPKDERNIKIGLLMRDRPELIEIRKKGLEEYVNLFIETNKIPKKKVLEIASDAVWFHGHKGRVHNKFGDVVFKKDRSASIMYSFKQYKFYYNSWTGLSFTRGYKDTENPIVKEVFKILHIVETSSNKKAVYDSIHKLKIDIYEGRLSLNTIAKDLVNDLIDRLDEMQMI